MVFSIFKNNAKQLIEDKQLSAFSYHTANWKYDKTKSNHKVTDKEVEFIVKRYLKILKEKKIINNFNNYDFKKLVWFTNNMNKEEIISNLAYQKSLKNFKKYSYKDFEKNLNI